MTQREQTAEVSGGQDGAKSKSTNSKRTSFHPRIQPFIRLSSDRCPAAIRELQNNVFYENDSEVNSAVV